jgi:hypothetical protein
MPVATRDLSLEKPTCWLTRKHGRRVDHRAPRPLTGVFPSRGDHALPSSRTLSGVIGIAAMRSGA